MCLNLKWCHDQQPISSTFMCISYVNLLAYRCSSFAQREIVMLELQTPFVFRRLPGANDEEEESLLLDQQPIFADDTFANTSVWATPKLGENSRSRPSPYLPVRNASTSEDVEHARDVYPSGGADDLAADCSFSFEQSTFIDRGQRTVLVGGADAARRRDSDHAKRGASSPEASGSSKRGQFPKL